MIDYISLNEGLLELHSGEELVFAGRNAQTLADVAIRNGGMSTHVMFKNVLKNNGLQMVVFHTLMRYNMNSKQKGATL